MVIIKQFEIFKLSIPLSHAFVTNKRKSTDMNSLIFKVALSDGTIGWGEAAENISLTGITIEGMLKYSNTLIRHILDEEINAALQLVSESEYNSAKYGIETALLDAASQSQKIPISELLGISKPKSKIINDTTISIMNSEETIRYTTNLIEQGYRHIKYKLGPSQDEIKRILQLSQYLSQNISIRIDPNQAWNKESALKYISLLQKSSLNIDLIEQPVEQHNLTTLKELAQFSTIPIVADESVFGIQDAKKIINGKFADMLNIKLIKCGGPIEAVRIAKFAQKNNIKCMFGCTSEANIAITMAAYLASCLPNVVYYDLDGLDFISESPFCGGVVRDKDKLIIPDGIGLEIQSNKNIKFLKLVKVLR
jgi:L-alanine-DL-glutamate epimerase-like enolase superfamily enzyme